MEDIRAGVCPLCRNNEVVQSEMRETSEGKLLPLAVAYGHSATVGAFAFKPSGYEGPPSSILPVGRLSVFMCRRCGFSQLFAQDPGNVPIDASLGTRLVEKP